MKRDSIYYQIFKRFPALIFELVDDRPQHAQNYRFESVEVTNTLPIGINLMQLTIASEKAMASQAKQLIERVQLESTGTLPKNEIIDIITTIAVYKFSSLSREEVEAMLGLNIEETRIYKDLERQTKLKAAARLLRMGYSILEVAKAVDLSVEEITTEVVNSQTPTEQDRTE
ncbi:hypothetical protein NIES2111_66520 (plasmid) [Nostoc sp. NIES-2111]|nr:hypothetical protein NIES2111_66520 [Nostoc sp. NIES-2111]